jgi:hypothetical protein
MAGSYTVQTQVKSVQVLGPTQVIDVQQVGISTHPTGIFIEYPIPIELWHDPNTNFILEAIASGIEQQISEGLAVGGSYVQDYDKSNLLVDYWEAIVEYTPPDGRLPMSTTVLVPLGAFVGLGGDPFTFGLAGNPAMLLSAALDQLKATANL